MAIIARWSEPRSSSTQKSWNVSIILGEAKIRSFTSSFPVASFVYVGSLSLIFVYLCCSVYCTSNLPSLSAVSCPKFTCLQLKSPVMICFDMSCADGVDDFVRWVFSGAVNGSDLYRFGCYVDEYGMVVVGSVVVIVVVVLCGKSVLYSIATPLPGFSDGYEIL